ncbi:nicotinate-nucleotide-dimethylbenzimidazole phosphoribosyltransferase prokaryotic [Lucifera butyrica]|uniref:Nicotinate-nucleotide--dimethylbenzimidazole phosphoribosyltransferase n=1 Tax=Lucifera butyrica TaxID=1351585 RepID=A0A498R9G3_9FIRM|nr:nicotinate-nucleotide--dimethylbenzimidazole phosphoribosyltransferase [Lucifera butyrica]VBB07809.1 nicotinate-nucleotide-dimethylbenzimidazole phosphoribosyltransferase prokaryotic [Lucifera butyrica]
MIQDAIAAIGALNTETMDRCQLRLDNLTKPLNSLHGLEYLARKMAGITGNARPRSLKKSIVLMAADHGVAVRDPSQPPPFSTARRMENICRGCAAINTFAGHVAANLVPVDMGIAADMAGMPQLRQAKLAYGTKDITGGPAMTREQAVAAIETGIRIAREEITAGTQVIGLGEIGVANAIASTAVIACYCGRPACEKPDAARQRKIDLVETALSVNQPDPGDSIEVLARVGGFEIGALAGVILGAAAYRAAVVLDGLPTAAAALLAVKLAPAAKEYLIGSHFAPEPGHKAALERIGVPAYLHLDLQLGEGTGAVLGMSLINAGLHVLNDMKTFGEAEVAIAQDGPGASKQSKHVRD